jgi:hypothetical protein
MTKKIERKRRIKNFLRLQTEALTVSEIHEAMVKRQGLDISRKTIERDIIEMVEDDLIDLSLGTPTRYRLKRATEVDLALKVEEITLLLELLDQNSELHQKLKRALV